jgi:DNA mismatch repair protein MutS2
VHGSSAQRRHPVFSKPAATVELNNDIVELEDLEREEIFRILLELTDRFRNRPGTSAGGHRGGDAFRCLQAKARYASRVNAVRARFTGETRLELTGRAPSDDQGRGPVDVKLEPPNRVADYRPEHRRQDGRLEDAAGLFALMAQRRLHYPADIRSGYRVSNGLLPTSATRNRLPPA